MRWIDERNRSQVFLAGSDSRKDDPLRTAVPLTAVREFLESLPTAKRVLVVDACFTGEGKVLAEQVQGQILWTTRRPAPPKVCAQGRAHPVVRFGIADQEVETGGQAIDPVNEERQMD